MTETYYAGAYWWARQEDVGECARRARLFFLHMAQCSPLLAHWLQPPRSRELAPESFEPDIPTLEEMFARGRTRNDEGGVIEDLGFTLYADAIGKQPSSSSAHASLRIKCGGYAEHMGSNACVLSLPSTSPYVEQLLTGAALTNIVRAMALAWEPDWACATSHEHRETTNRTAAGTFVGWVMYFASRRGPVPPLPEPVRVERVEGRGTLVTLTPERFTVSNPEHMELGARVHQLLDGAGLLVPTNPWQQRSAQ